MKEKKLTKKQTIILAIVAALVCLVGVGTAVFFLQKPEEQEPAETYIICWNPDSATYADADTGMSARPADEDGKFTVQLLVDGAMVTYRASTKRTVNLIDAANLVGVKADEEGWITEVVDVEEATGARVFSYYVESMNEEKLVLNSSKYFSGQQIVIKAEDETPVYDVTVDKQELGKLVTSAEKEDIVAVVKDGEGNVLQAFLTAR